MGFSWLRTDFDEWFNMENDTADLVLLIFSVQMLC